MKKDEINARVNSLRDIMQQNGIQAVIVPQTDPHMGEYLADHWQIRRWLSGFTGSAGDLVVTRTEAFVWADSRYWLQAASQLDGTCIGVMEDGKPQTPSIASYLCSALHAGDTVGIDGMVFSANAATALQSQLATAGIKLRVDFNPIDLIWLNRPSIPANEAFIHDEKYSGQSAGDKIAAVLQNAERAGASATFISDLAEIAWTLNLRSSDVECNPVLTSFLYLGADEKCLFVDPAKIPADVMTYLDKVGVKTLPYTDVAKFLGTLPDDVKVLINPAQTSIAISTILGKRAVEGASPVAMLKAVKNPVQLQGVRNAMVRDGVALVSAFMELEQRMADGVPTTEIDVADLLLKYRSASPMFFDLSFETIAGFGPHGAIVHYSANEASNATLHPDSLLLVDSGANYLDGTTDITRTISLGTPTNEQRHDFTLVMKGHISLATAFYPEGTRGAQLDVLARINLWKEGLSYLHGTGHGVGHFLNVHEGPQSIRLNDTMAPLTPGMITSNEPGLYREGQYGIRCENLVLTTEAFTTDFGRFYAFETLTLFPFDLTLFDTAIMTDAEIDWVNAYHAMVRERLMPHLSEAARAWLIDKTRTLTR
ncbi:MAG: aminopeptidase P family protein [Firmicutes bacterium]|nr:aminopeptidase P family protein [Bacillota bacterium]MCM1400727.1 aminopeptidase P family protein [Bacteroides sp.]